MKKYAAKIGNYDAVGGIRYTSIYPSLGQVRMCITDEKPVYELEITESNVPDCDSYWAWKSQNGNIGMIYPTFQLMDMCFPYGSAAEEKAGVGEVIRVDIKELSIIKSE